jgi:hypothetical protein
VVGNEGVCVYGRVSGLRFNEKICSLLQWPGQSVLSDGDLRRLYNSS